MRSSFSKDYILNVKVILTNETEGYLLRRLTKDQLKPHKLSTLKKIKCITCL